MNVLLRAGDAEVDIDAGEGGRIGQITVGGHRFLRGREESEGTWPYWGSYPLLPWSNRIPGGEIRYDGASYAVDVNWSDGTALHGLAQDTPWTVESSSPTDVTLTVDVAGGPYVARGRQEFTLTEGELAQVLSVRNDASVPLPFGLGIHPWFHAGEVRVPAAEVWPAVDALPIGAPRPVTAEEDLRTRRTPPPLDHCFTALEGTDADVPGLRLSWDGPITQVVVYTLVDGWMCVEPVTMANDGIRLRDEGVAGHGVVDLEPGASMEVRYRFSWPNP